MQRTIVVIFARVDHPPTKPTCDAVAKELPGACGVRHAVSGGYLERLPLAAIVADAFDSAEIRHHCSEPRWESAMLGCDGTVRRGCDLSNSATPFDSYRMIERLEPRTAMLAPGHACAAAFCEMLGRLGDFDPRPEAIARWSWPVSIRRFLAELDNLPTRETRRHAIA